MGSTSTEETDSIPKVRSGDGISIQIDTCSIRERSSKYCDVRLNPCHISFSSAGLPESEDIKLPYPIARSHSISSGSDLSRGCGVESSPSKHLLDDPKKSQLLAHSLTDVSVCDGQGLG